MGYSSHLILEQGPSKLGYTLKSIARILAIDKLCPHQTMLPLAPIF